MPREVSSAGIAAELQPLFLKIHFDGSYHNDGSSGAGVVVFHSEENPERFLPCCEMSILLTVTNACQAEMSAMV